MELAPSPRVTARALNPISQGRKIAFNTANELFLIHFYILPP